MNSLIRFILLVTVVIVFISCKSNPTNAVGDTGPTTSGYIKGSVIDSSSKEHIPNVQIVLSDIYANSDFADTVFTNEEGRFEIGNVYEKEYYLSLKSIGYVCKDILISVTDTLNISEPIALMRNRYPYKIFPIDNMPTDSTKSGYYYKYNPSVYSSDFTWFTAYDASQAEVDEVKVKIDSLIITLLQNEIKPDTLWYKFWQPDCGNTLPAFDPVLVVMLNSEGNKILDYNFLRYDFEVISAPNCIDSSETILRNTFFDL